LRNTINFAEDLPEILQVLNRFDTGNEGEVIIAIWKRFPI